MPESLARRTPLFLQPAEMVVAERPLRVRTVLGSCVAVIMRAPRLGVAAMVHCLLPNGKNGTRNDALKYVDSAITVMLAALARRGAACADLEVKLFGGADGLDNTEAGSPYRVGGRNIESALDALAKVGLGVASSDVGGGWARLIELDTATGDVLVKRLPPASAGFEGGEP